MVCTVSNEQTVPSQEEVVGDPGKLVFGGCEVDGDECPGPFDTALAYFETHGWPKTGGDLPALERGGLCRSFKSDEWGASTTFLSRLPLVHPGSWLWDCARQSILQGW